MISVSAAMGVVAQDVCKSFDDHVVLDKVSLAVEEGTILALLGPNGDGKTTMVRTVHPDPRRFRLDARRRPRVVTDPNGWGPSSGSPVSSRPPSEEGLSTDAGLGRVVSAALAGDQRLPRGRKTGRFTGCVG